MTHSRLKIDASRRSQEDIFEQPDSRVGFAFETDRLRVYELDLIPIPGINYVRTIYLAFRTDIDWPFPCVTFTMHAENVEMAATHDFHRKEGLATELWFGIERYLGREIDGDPVTKSGERLMRKIQRVRAVKQ
jgi:hypothetical protein